MSTGHRALQLFEEVLDQPVTQRVGWLAQACQGDLDLLEEAWGLLHAHEHADGVLDSPPPLPPTVTQAGAQVGSHVGPYQIVRELGRGGMGVVYQAFDARLDRFVALKFLVPSLNGDAEAGARLLAEARAAAALSHPNLCVVHDVGTAENGQLYIAMAYWEGQTLTERLGEGALPPERGLTIAIQVLEGLRCAHEAGIIHRDVKPSNILLTTRGDARLMDFGVAKLLAQPSLTEPGARIGTVAYMSPEQARGLPVDARTDLWSVGVLLHEMVMGRLPDPWSRGALAAILSDDPVPVADPPPTMPALAPVLRRALAKRPQDRYASAEEFLADLRAVATGATTVGPRMPTGTFRGNLPPALTSFVGRESEQDRLPALLAAVPLVTLTGPAGTGKTRLALQVAAALVPTFDGTFLVPLAAITDPELVLPAVVQALGSGEQGFGSALDVLQDRLSGRRVLLILDNFEQVTAAAPHVSALLAACPGVKLLVTSRVALRVTGEHEFPVEPLPTPARGATLPIEELKRNPAVTLFLERARAARPDFVLDAENVGAVAELCAQLDGLPLALELAAARVKLFSPQAMVQRLANGLDLLKGGPRDRPARHQSLRQAVAWSYDLLPERERRFFRALSVFTGGFTLDAAEALCDGQDGLDVMASLVDHSLVRRGEEPDGEPRFLLLETIRAFAGECLHEAGEAGPAQRAHAAYYATFAERAEAGLSESDQAAWLDRLEREHGNLRTALAWAEAQNDGTLGLRLGAALWRFWVARGHLIEGLARMTRLVALPADGVPTSVRARALNGYGTLLHCRGENEAARRVLAESLEHWRHLDDRHGIATVLNNLGWVACELSDFETCRRQSEEALALHEQGGTVRGMAVALNNIGWIANYRGEYREARQLHERSLTLRHGVSDRRGVAYAQTNLAWAEFGLGEYERAGMHLDQAEALFRSVQDSVLLAWTLTVRAWRALDCGEDTAARSALDEAVRLWRAVGNRSGLAWALTLGSRLAIRYGDAAEAERLAEESRTRWQAIGSPWGNALATHALAVSVAAAEPARARNLLEECLAVRRSLRDRRGVAECHEQLAALDTSGGAVQRAAERLGLASQLRLDAGAALPRAKGPAVAALSRDLEKSLGRHGYQAAFARGQAEAAGLWPDAQPEFAQP